MSHICKHLFECLRIEGNDEAFIEINSMEYVLVSKIRRLLSSFISKRHDVWNTGRYKIFCVNGKYGIHSGFCIFFYKFTE